MFEGHIIIRVSDRKAIYETFNPKVVAALNTEKYRAVPANEYLGNINKQVSAGYASEVKEVKYDGEFAD